MGNPGRQYLRTRHNAGFMVVDALARNLNVDDRWKTKDGARQIVDHSHSTILIEPQTFMNASGEPTQRIATFYKISAPQILAVVDDLDLPFGKLRMRERGSSGGHNGLKSLIAHLGDDFPRLRIGIGRDGSGEAIERVLGSFSDEEELRLATLIAVCVQGIELWLAGKTVMAINLLNSFTAEG